MTEQDEFRNYIINTMNEHKAKNQAFSMRAFAKRCSVHPAVISEILSGKRRVSAAYAEKILDNLMVDPLTKHDLIARFDKKSLTAAKSKMQLKADQYFIVADPLYYSILSLLETKNPPKNATAIAKRLSCSSAKVTKALERLIRLKLIEKNKNKLVKSEYRLTTTEDIPNSSITKRHESNLQDALKSLYSDALEERDFSCITMAIDPSKLPLAKKMIRQFRQDIAKHLECGNQSEVYELSIQLFPRTKKEKIR